MEEIEKEVEEEETEKEVGEEETEKEVDEEEQEENGLDDNDEAISCIFSKLSVFDSNRLSVRRTIRTADICL
ncbi:hypothetical protein TNIN_136771 [Trichonephila inaurata madagascariensis]|uniref:Uncharacterized protein n=1 Tax=Trichonephila inaurata madagascariensis TaxID=2747483 RepID=A0A8X6XE48_9ARAC|nr:hypothetical protein TNIN_136771 [Trichonephila inaurata madagascariensis]